MNGVIRQKQIIDGIQFYYELFGVESNQPTIVLESGYGCPSEYWDPIKEGLSKLTKVFVYDRAGIGRSEKAGRPKDSKQSVINLHLLLQKANVKPPYILIGHSFGGANARLFAHTYPTEVSALILLDSCHEDQNLVMLPLFPEEVKENYLGQFNMEGSEGTFEEFKDSLDQVRECESLGNLPLVVISAGKRSYHSENSFAAWCLFQRDLLRLSTNSKQFIVKDAGHAIHIDSPKSVIDIVKTALGNLIF